jgi:hypothetical protein
MEKLTGRRERATTPPRRSIAGNDHGTYFTSDERPERIFEISLCMNHHTHTHPSFFKKKKKILTVRKFTKKNK